jgi:molybdopterin molybdotransferase
VRDRGEDAKAGELLLPRGTALGIPEAGLLWAQGLTHVPTFRPPRVAILSTGDELCAVEDAADELIVDTNGPSLAAAVRRAGGEPTLLGIARDSLEDVLAKLEPALGYDAVLTSAGVSVGEKDFVKEALAKLGVAMDFWRVAIKPGKPLAVGRRGDTVFFGLPGNPTSSLVSFELFVRPALRRWLGHAEVEPGRVPGRVEVPLKKPAGLTHYVRVTARWQDGQLWARPLASQTSGALRSAASATHLLEFPRDAVGLSPGDPAALLTLSWTG